MFSETMLVTATELTDKETAVGRPLRIAHVVSSLMMGGMEQFVLRLAHAQQQVGHSVGVLAIRGGPLLEQAEALGIKARVLQGSAPRRVATAAAYFAVERPQIVHAHNPTSLHYAVISRRVGRSRVLMTDHAQTRGVIRVPTDREWRLTDAVAAVSQHTFTATPMPQMRAGKHVIHNGIEPPIGSRSRREVRAELGIGEEPVAIMVAGFDAVKGHRFLLHALRTLQEQSVNLTTLLAGDGVEKSEMEALCTELNLAPKSVRFLGRRRDVPDLLTAADIFVLPSLMEGLPLAVLEAMALRLPVIATPVGGVPELLTNDVEGLLVPPRDCAALANAIERLAKNSALRDAMGARGLARVLGQFSFSGMVHRYDDLYRSILAV